MATIKHKYWSRTFIKNNQAKTIAHSNQWCQHSKIPKTSFVGGNSKMNTFDYQLVNSKSCQTQEKKSQHSSLFQRNGRSDPGQMCNHVAKNQSWHIWLTWYHPALGRSSGTDFNFDHFSTHLSFLPERDPHYKGSILKVIIQCLTKMWGLSFITAHIWWAWGMNLCVVFIFSIPRSSGTSGG